MLQLRCYCPVCGTWMGRAVLYFSFVIFTNLFKCHKVNKAIRKLIYIDNSIIFLSSFMFITIIKHFPQ